METRILNNFIIVAEEKSLRRAAMRLHMTQPALSRQIQSLEEEIGLPLFIRSANGMDITPAGETLLHHARNINAEIDLAKKNTILSSNAIRKNINIGVCSSATFNIVPEILEQFSKLHPKVDLTLHSGHTERHIQSLRHGRILIAFDRFLHEDDDLTCENVISEPVLLALHKDHHLANKNTIVSIRELQDELFIGGPDKSHDDQGFEIRGYKPRISKRATDLMNMLTLVGCGYGIGFAPASFQSLQIRNVVYRPYLESEKTLFTLQCIYCKNEKSPLLQDLLETIRTYRAAHSIHALN